MQVTGPQTQNTSVQQDSAVAEYLQKHYPHFGIMPSAGDIRVAKRVFGTSEIIAASPSHHASIIKPLCELCETKGIKDVPKLMIARSPVQNASVTSEGTLIVSEGLVETLNQDEMRAVIVHELDHYKKRETSSVIAHAVGFLADFFVGLFGGRKIDHIIENNSKLQKMPRVGKFISHTIPALGLHYLVVAPTHALFRRRSEFEADKEAAQTVGYENVIGVLKFFDELYESRRGDQHPRTIINRVRSNSVLDNVTAVLYPFPDHPTFKERIEKLEKERAVDPNTRVTAMELQAQIQNAPSTYTVH